MRILIIAFLLLSAGCASDGRMNLKADWDTDLRQQTPDQQPQQEKLLVDPEPTNPSAPRI